MKKNRLFLLLLAASAAAIYFICNIYNNKFKSIEARLRIAVVEQYNITTSYNDQKRKSLISATDDLTLFPMQIIQSVNGIKKGSKIAAPSYPVLVFRFTSMNCGTCVDSTIDVLKRNIVGTCMEKHIFFLVSYDYENYLNEWIRLNGISLPIYSISLNEMPLRAEQENAPYLFLVGKDKAVSHLFFPDKHDKLSTLQYLNLVKNKFFNN